MKRSNRILAVAMGTVMGIGLLSACTDKGGDSKPAITVDNETKYRAEQLADNVFASYIDQELWSLPKSDPDRELYVFSGYSQAGKSGEGSASVWHYTSVYELANKMYALFKDDEKGKVYKQWISDLYDGLEWYQGTGTMVEFTGVSERTVYGVNRSTRGKNEAVVDGDKNVYDDQMWLLREMLESYKLTGESKYLERAEYLANYCLAGWDCSLDADGNEYGGILWGPAYTGRHTCSNGPIISPLVWLYEVYKDSTETIEYKYQDRLRNVKSETMKKADYYLMFAKKVYNYTMTNLKKSNDLFYDSRGYEVGYYEVEGTTQLKYSIRDKADFDHNSLTYNSGTPLSGAVDLYRVTGDQIYLEQAKKIAAAAYDFFGDKTFMEGIVRYPTHSITTWFNFVLYRGYNDLYSVCPTETTREYVDSYRNLINYAYENYYRDGFMPRDLAGGWHVGYENDNITSVMDASAAAQTMALSALIK